MYFPQQQLISRMQESKIGVDEHGKYPKKNKSDIEKYWPKDTAHPPKPPCLGETTEHWVLGHYALFITFYADFQVLKDTVKVFHLGIHNSHWSNLTEKRASFTISEICQPFSIFSLLSTKSSYMQ